MRETEEFGDEHEGRPGVLLAGGTEPGPVHFDAGSGPTVHQSTDRYVYDGTPGVPVATEMRGACSCGRRGTPRSPLGWEAVERRKPYLFDTSGPEDDWDAHIADVQARTVPPPVDLTAFLDQVETSHHPDRRRATARDPGRRRPGTHDPARGGGCRVQPRHRGRAGPGRRCPGAPGQPADRPLPPDPLRAPPLTGWCAPVAVAAQPSRPTCRAFSRSVNDLGTPPGCCLPALWPTTR